MTEHVAVIGAGLMGHTIALSFARAGHHVFVYDPDPSSLAALPGRLRGSLAQLGVPDEQADTVIGSIRASSTLDTAVATATYVTEAAPEKPDLKRAIFADLYRLAPPDAVLASNTSVIPITQIADGAPLEGRDRIIGTHWWNPGHLIPLVEVVRTEWTSADTVDHTCRILAGIGKTPVRVQHDIPGFVGNRLQHALWREAISLVEHGVCTAEDVDLVVTSSFGRRLAVLGPLANADLIGTDLTLDIHEQVLHDLDARGEPSPYLRSLVAKKHLGMKSGRGFREWTPHTAQDLRIAVAEHLTMLTTSHETAGGKGE